MEYNQLDPITSWHISNYFAYILLAAILSTFLRVVSCLLKSIHHLGYKKEIVNEFLIQFRGERTSGDHIEKGDFWFPTIIGFFEFLCFPVLMSTRNWLIIGAWIGFKALPVWSAWQKDRSTFNRFLIGQVLVIIFSAILLTKFIQLPTHVREYFIK